MNIALTLLALPVLCAVICSLKIDPAHDWMMRHDCPFAMLPHYARPLPIQQSHAPMSR